MRLRQRIRAVEKLDAPHHDPAVLRSNFAHIAAVNRWLGGTRVVLRTLSPLVRPGGAVCLLDVGTGGADIPRSIVEWARKTRRRITVYGVDRSRQIARLASEASRHVPQISTVVGDALCLPVRDAAVDLAVSCMTLHHFTDDQAVGCLREMVRVARVAVVIADLERHPVNYVGARILASTRWRRHEYARHDGPLSVQRAFRLDELRRLARQAGITDSHVRRRFPYRVTLLAPVGGTRP